MTITRTLHLVPPLGDTQDPASRAASVEPSTLDGVHRPRRPEGIDVADQRLIDAWIAWYAAGDASPGTMKIRRNHLTRFAHAHLLAAATEDDVVDWLTSSAGISANSRRSARASLRSFYMWGVGKGLLTCDPTVRLRVISEPAGIPRPIPEADFAYALAHATVEQELMLRLGGYGGLRRAEIAAVHSDDVTEMGLTVHGKGRKVRRVPIHHSLLQPLRAVSGWAFPSPVHPGRPVTPDYIADRLEQVLPEPWTTHSLRHRFATQAFRGTHNLRAVQILLGHASVATTQRYVQVDEDALVNAVGSVA